MHAFTVTWAVAVMLRRVEKNDPLFPHSGKGSGRRIDGSLK
ncbi:hypothetical protein QW131_25815 [Roseibium salinum]|nr:hypothetical protein [Roseibium salinum]